MAYATPNYDHGLQTSDLTTKYQQGRAQQDFGRMVGQQRHSRNLEDMNRGFKKGFPKVGSAFNQRGMWNSGMRREGQQEAAEGYQRQVADAQYGHGIQEQQYQMDRTNLDANYQNALLQLAEQMSSGQASGQFGFDPFQALRALFPGGN